MRRPDIRNCAQHVERCIDLSLPILSAHRIVRWPGSCWDRRRVFHQGRMDKPGSDFLVQPAGIRRSEGVWGVGAFRFQEQRWFLRNKKAGREGRGGKKRFADQLEATLSNIKETTTELDARPDFLPYSEYYIRGKLLDKTKEEIDKDWAEDRPCDIVMLTRTTRMCCPSIKSISMSRFRCLFAPGWCVHSLVAQDLANPNVDVIVENGEDCVAVFRGAKKGRVEREGVRSTVKVKDKVTNELRLKEANRSAAAAHHAVSAAFSKPLCSDSTIEAPDIDRAEIEIPDRPTMPAHMNALVERQIKMQEEEAAGSFALAQSDLQAAEDRHCEEHNKPDTLLEWHGTHVSGYSTNPFRTLGNLWPMSRWTLAQWRPCLPCPFRERCRVDLRFARNGSCSRRRTGPPLRRRRMSTRGSRRTRPR